MATVVTRLTFVGIGFYNSLIIKDDINFKTGNKNQYMCIRTYVVENFSRTLFSLDFARTSVQFREACFHPYNDSAPPWSRLISVNSGERK